MISVGLVKIPDIFTMQDNFFPLEHNELTHVVALIFILKMRSKARRCL